MDWVRHILIHFQISLADLNVRPSDRGSSASGSDTTATLSATQSQPAPTNPTSYPSNSSLFFPSYTASSLAGTPRPIRRRANGEGTSRLSVVYFDDEGYGRKAYIDGAGGGFGGVGGILGRY